MTSEEIISAIARSKSDNKICTVKCYHETDRRFLLPLKMSDVFYLSAIESGMAFDGYLIDRISSIETIIPSGDNSDRLLKESGILKDLSVPSMELTSPDRFFAYLVSNSTPVCLECAEEGSLDVGFFTGVITDCNESTFDIRCFDTYCNWSPTVMTIPYEDFLRLSFGTDVLRTYAAALPRMPQRRR